MAFFPGIKMQCLNISKYMHLQRGHSFSFASDCMVTIHVGLTFTACVAKALRGIRLVEEFYKMSKRRLQMHVSSTAATAGGNESLRFMFVKRSTKRVFVFLFDYNGNETKTRH